MSCWVIIEYSDEVGGGIDSRCVLVLLDVTCSRVLYSKLDDCPPDIDDDPPCSKVVPAAFPEFCFFFLYDLSGTEYSTSTISLALVHTRF